MITKLKYILCSRDLNLKLKKLIVGYLYSTLLYRFEAKTLSSVMEKEYGRVKGRNTNGLSGFPRSIELQMKRFLGQ